MNGLRPGAVGTLAAASLCLAALLWIPFRPADLYTEDAVSFARSLKNFNPAASRPQWPGYPLFVMQSKALRILFGSAERTFLVGVILGTAVALVFMVLLGRELGKNLEAGFTAALLFIVNPAFLFTGLASPIRIYLASVSTAVAYFCWRMKQRDLHWWPATVALGIGSGYRPELLAVLTPLWAYCIWRSHGWRRESVRAAGVLTICVLVWLAILVSAGTPLIRMPAAVNAYLAGQASDTSPVYGAPLRGWATMLAHLAAWYGMAIAGWIVFVPFVRAKLPAGSGVFLMLWIVPSLLLHALVHIGAADQALVVIPAFCLLGGVLLWRLLQRNVVVGIVALSLAMTLNLKTFFRPVSMHPERATSALGFFRERLKQGLWLMSFATFEDVETQTWESFAHLHELLGSRSGPAVIVWDQSRVLWQRVSYYFPAADIWVVRRTPNPPDAIRVRDGAILERLEGSPVRIPLRGASRIIWLAPANAVRSSLPDADVQCMDRNTCWGAAQSRHMQGYDLVP